MSTILVVDDEYAIVEALSALLEDEGYRVLTAANGEEALGRIEDGLAPDLILLDVMMPRLDGREVLRWLRSDPGRSRIPVVMMSAASQPLPREQLGDAVFLHKPFDLALLLRTIDALLRPKDPPGPDGHPGPTGV
jgi:CheY-like chemotaxis protein